MKYERIIDNLNIIYFSPTNFNVNKKKINWTLVINLSNQCNCRKNIIIYINQKYIKISRLLYAYTSVYMYIVHINLKSYTLSYHIYTNFHVRWPRRNLRIAWLTAVYKQQVYGTNQLIKLEVELLSTVLKMLERVKALPSLLPSSLIWEHILTAIELLSIYVV